MKKLLLSVMVLALFAGTAFAGAIYDCNTGVYTELDVLTVEGAVVTAVTYNGFSATDIPAGPYTAAWVYTGGAPTVAIGDVVTLTDATYKEYYDLTELDMTTSGTGLVTVTGTAVAPVFTMTLAEVQADDEAWEAHVLNITDGFMVSELLSYGEWKAISQESGLVLHHDDIMFDETGLAVGDCYLGVTGYYTYSYGTFRMIPYVDGLVEVDCTVDNETTSFGSVKALYR